MLESRFQSRRIFGSIFVFLGVVGISYIIWTYFIWEKTLPKFDGNSILAVGDEISINPNSAIGSGFAALLEPTTIPAAAATNSDPPGNTINIDRILGDKTNNVEGYNVDEVQLTVPRLNIFNAKVALDVNGDDERIYDGVLKKAVGHLYKSAYPGEIGNTFLFGHSMLPLLSAAGGYESIFTNLPQVKVGDVVKVGYQNKEFTYQIMQTGVVKPTDVFIMNQPTTKRMLTLMTCIPPGFANSRYITLGELINVTER